MRLRGTVNLKSSSSSSSSPSSTDADSTAGSRMMRSISLSASLNCVCVMGDSVNSRPSCCISLRVDEKTVGSSTGRSEGVSTPSLEGSTRSSTTLS